MKKPTVFPYTKGMDQCGICNMRVRRPTCLGHYLVGDRGAISYPVCASCAAAFARGLPYEQLRNLDNKMERRAIECGLSQPQQGEQS